MSEDLGRWALGVALTLVGLWLLLLLALVLLRPTGARASAAREVLRSAADVVRLVGRLARDPDVPRGARLGLWLLLGYLVLPLDLVPDVLPVVGQLDDVVVAAVVLRAVVRRAGPDVVRRSWSGSPEGLAAVLRLTGLPADP